jgi:hypothetical protein
MHIFSDNTCVCRFWTFKMLFPPKADPACFVSYSLKTGNSAQESLFHFLNCLRTANRTDGFLNGTLVDMTTLSATLMVPDQFINGKILTAARGTHDTSLTLTPYGNNRKSYTCQGSAYHPVLHSGCLCGLTVSRTVKITSQKGPDKDLGTVHFPAVPAGRFPRFIITVIA